MCVSSSPAAFSKTIIYAGESTWHGDPVHVLAYQNTAKSLISGAPNALRRQLIQQQTRTAFDWNTISGAVSPQLSGIGNAMILPIPATGEMSAFNVLRTKDSPRILEDIRQALPRTQARGVLLNSGGSGTFKGGVQVFDTGIYTVVLIPPGAAVEHVTATLENNVSPAKRPSISSEMISTYLDKWYLGWWIAICCFNNTQAIKADPLVWVYEPMFPNVLFVPGLDGHDGGLPSFDHGVVTDHTIAVGSKGLKIPSQPSYPFGPFPVQYQDELSNNLKEVLPLEVLGRDYDETMKNGDWVFLVSDVRAGVFSPERLRPPGA